MRALLVIDTQKGSFTERTPRFNTSEVVEKINALATVVRIAKAPVIFIQHDDLIITGCATDFCVAATVQSALTKDYTITVVEEGHTTGERPHLTAKQVIDHYNWVWQHMTPTRGRVYVEKFTQIKSSFV